ncbi:UPF0758 domain-containing protein [Pedobacter panaciterrae]
MALRTGLRAPREKLCDYGAEALENAKLLAILIGSAGTFVYGCILMT